MDDIFREISIKKGWVIFYLIQNFFFTPIFEINYPPQKLQMPIFFDGGGDKKINISSPSLT